MNTSEISTHLIFRHYAICSKLEIVMQSTVGIFRTLETNPYMVASTSGSISTGTLGALLPPLKREDTLSIALLSWLIFAFKVCLVLCFRGKGIQFKV